jgi:hypothetical protein
MRRAFVPPLLVVLWLSAGPVEAADGPPLCQAGCAWFEERPLRGAKSEYESRPGGAAWWRSAATVQQRYSNGM